MTNDASAYGMNTQRFNVVMQGTTLRGQDVATVAAALAWLIKRDIDLALGLLRGQPTRLKSGVDAATGSRYMETLERIGVAVLLEPETLDVDADLSVPPANIKHYQPGDAASIAGPSGKRAQAEFEVQHGGHAEPSAKRVVHGQSYATPATATMNAVDGTATASNGKGTPEKVRDEANSPSVNAGPPLWNLNSLSLWVLGGIQLPAFVVASNWKALNEPEKAEMAWLWFAGTLAIAIAIVTYPVLFTASLQGYLMLMLGWFGYLIAWCLLCFAPQRKYVQSKFGNVFNFWWQAKLNCPRKPMWLAVSITLVLSFLFQFTVREMTQHSASHRSNELVLNSAATAAPSNQFAAPSAPSASIDTPDIHWYTGAEIETVLVGTWMCHALDQPETSGHFVLIYRADGTMANGTPWHVGDDQLLYANGHFPIRLNWEQWGQRFVGTEADNSSGMSCEKLGG